MVESTHAPEVADPSMPSEMLRRYTRLLRDYLAHPARDACLVAQCWRDITDEALENFAARLAREPADILVGDVIECLNNVVMCLPQGASLGGDAGASLLVQMALVTVERWLHVKADLGRLTQDGIPTLPLLEDTVAAMVAASCLGLNLNLSLRYDSAGQPELVITNLVADAEELQLGCIDSQEAIGRALMSRALPANPLAARSALPSDSLVFDQVRRHARKTGARLIVGLPSGQHALARHVAQQWGAGAFLRADAASDGSGPAPHPLVALQNDVKTHLGMVRVALAAHARVEPPVSVPVQPPVPGPRRPLVFISYAHEDVALRQEFEQHLKTYVVSGALTLWTDDLIQPGSEWQPAIRDGIKRCSVAVLLLTHNFMASDFIINTEMPLLGERYDPGEIRIVPILMQPCNAVVNAWLVDRQVEPAIDQPVPAPNAGHARNETLTALAKTVHQYATQPQHPRTPA